MNILLIGSNLDISALYETRLKGRGQVLFNCILSYISSVRKIFSVKKIETLVKEEYLSCICTKEVNLSKVDVGHTEGLRRYEDTCK